MLFMIFVNVVHNFYEVCMNLVESIQFIACSWKFMKEFHEHKRNYYEVDDKS